MSSVSMINGHIDKHEEPERDRLVELLDDGCKNVTFHDKRRVNEQVADHLLLNGVIVPPCKVGQTVYQICFGKLSEQKIIKQSKVTGIKITDKLTITLDYTTNFYDTDIGYWLFLTKEEALSKLQASCKQVKGD